MSNWTLTYYRRRSEKMKQRERSPPRKKTKKKAKKKKKKGKRTQLDCPDEENFPANVVYIYRNVRHAHGRVMLQRADIDY